MLLKVFFRLKIDAQPSLLRSMVAALGHHESAQLVTIWTSLFHHATLPCRGGLDRVSICEGLGRALAATTYDIGGGFGFGVPCRLQELSGRQMLRTGGSRHVQKHSLKH